MDGQRFDALTRAFQGNATRRRALAALVGLAAGSSALTGADATRSLCRQDGLGCTRGTQCCSGYCERRTTVRRARRNRCGCEAGQQVCDQTCCTAGELCIDGLCCAEGTQVTCDGVCCPVGEYCIDGACAPPCQTLISGATVCFFSRELVEWFECWDGNTGATTPAACSSTADCRQIVATNDPGFDCDAPGNGCVCSILWGVDGRSGTTPEGECVYGNVQIGGTCPED